MLYPEYRVHLALPVLHIPFPATDSHSCFCGPQAIKLQLCTQGMKFLLMRLPTQKARLADIFSNGFTSHAPYCSMRCCKGVYHGAEGLRRLKPGLKDADHLASPAWWVNFVECLQGLQGFKR